MKAITKGQYEHIAQHRQKLEVHYRSGYVRDLSAAWIKRAKEIYILITGKVPGDCPACLSIVLKVLFKALLRYEEESLQTSADTTIPDTGDLSSGEVLQINLVGNCRDCPDAETVSAIVSEITSQQTTNESKEKDSNEEAGSKEVSQEVDEGINGGNTNGPNPAKPKGKADKGRNKR